MRKERAKGAQMGCKSVRISHLKSLLAMFTCVLMDSLCENAFFAFQGGRELGRREGTREEPMEMSRC